MTDPLDAFIERQAGMVLVNLWADYADACRAMASLMDRLENEGEISAATWNVVADAVGPGPLQGLVEQVR